MAHDFRRLFEAEAPAVLRRLRWLGVPERDRLDVAQDVFVDVARHLGRLDPTRDARPWVLTVALNKARDYFGRARVQREQLGLDFDLASEGSAVDRLDARRTLQRCLGVLSLEHREVLLLVELEEHSVPEAAAILGLKVKATESRLLRAREALAAVAERLQRAERRVAGEAFVALPVDELVRAAREAPAEDFGAEVELLRGRVWRVLSSPAPSLPKATPTATWVGLLAVVTVAVFGAVDGIPAPPLRALPEPPPLVTVLAAVSSAAPSPPAPATSPSSAPSSPATARRAAAPKAAATGEGDLIALARRALLEKDGQRALRLLRQHEAQYPHGVFQPERVQLLQALSTP